MSDGERGGVEGRVVMAVHHISSKAHPKWSLQWCGSRNHAYMSASRTLHFPTSSLMWDVPPDRKATHLATREKLQRQAFPWKGPSILLQRHIDDLYWNFPEARFWGLDGERIWSLGQRVREIGKWVQKFHILESTNFFLEVNAHQFPR